MLCYTEGGEELDTVSVSKRNNTKILLPLDDNNRRMSCFIRLRYSYAASSAAALCVDVKRVVGVELRARALRYGLDFVHVGCCVFL